MTDLKVHKVQQAQNRLLLGEGYQDNDLVFCRNDGQPLNPRGFTLAFEKIIEQAGLPKITFHDMRHAHATMLLLLDEHPKVVQEWLGHSTISMTLD